MDQILLLACVAAAFILCFILSFLRGTRMERKLEELDRLVRLSLNQREKAKDQSGQLAELRLKMEAIGERVERSTETLENIQTTSSESKVEKVHDMVERKLYNMGYETVRLTGEDVDESPYRINLEVSRRGASYKGYALIEDGVIVDSRISPTYAMFP